MIGSGGEIWRLEWEDVLLGTAKRSRPSRLGVVLVIGDMVEEGDALGWLTLLTGSLSPFRVCFELQS